MRKKVSDAELRERVQARLTKGDAFRDVDYAAGQEKARSRLTNMSRAAIFANFPELTYDFKVK